MRTKAARTRHRTLFSQRLVELTELRPGWADGEGQAVDAVTVLRMVMLLDDLDESMPEPDLYPTIEGGLRAEWRMGAKDLSIEIVGHDYFAHVLDLETGEDAEQSGDDSRLAPPFLLAARV